METFTWLMAILAGSVAITALARRIGAPYPALLAVAGAALAFAPFAPKIGIPPDLTLALFVAPILLDAGYDTSPRDLRENWAPVAGLVFVAVGLTAAAVAWMAHALVPGMPWAAAIALGAIVSPPDASAATSVLRQLKPPHRIMVILEGESLLNDVTALLLFRFAVGAVAAGGFSLGEAAPIFLAWRWAASLLGYVLARLLRLLLAGCRTRPAPSSCSSSRLRDLDRGRAPASVAGADGGRHGHRHRAPGAAEDAGAAAGCRPMRSGTPWSSWSMSWPSP